MGTEDQRITEAREKYHRVIAKHYGKDYVYEVAKMISVGSRDYCDEVMQAHDECLRIIKNSIVEKK